MFNKEKISQILKEKGWSRYKLCKEAGMAQSTLSDILGGKNVSPKTSTLQRIADALNVPMSSFFDDESVKEDKLAYTSAVMDFAEPEDAIKFILSQPALMDFGGYDLKNMSNDEILGVANDMLLAMRLSLEKHKK